MVQQIHDILRPLKRSIGKIAIATIAITALSLGLIHPRTVIYTGDYELVYEESWAASACVSPDTCSMHYRMTLGNTGRQPYDMIELHFTGMPKDMQRWTINTFELQSTTRKIPGAEVSDIDGLGYNGLQVKGLHPGTAVEVEFINLSMPRQRAVQLKQQDEFVHVLAPGDVLQGNPRGTFFARLLTFFL